MDKAMNKKVLERAREIVSEPVRWVKRYEALDLSGTACDARSKDACQWCAWGALKRAARDVMTDQPDLTYRSAFRKHPVIVLAANVAAEMLDEDHPGFPELWPRYQNKITGFNDLKETKLADVLEMFDEAITRADRELAIEGG